MNKFIIAALIGAVSSEQVISIFDLLWPQDVDIAIPDSQAEIGLGAPIETQWDFENGEVDKTFDTDKDVISLEVNCDDQGISEGHVRIGLLEAGTWWKAVNQFTGTHFQSELVAVQDEPGTMKTAEVPVANLDLYTYVLSKAKILGVHCDMYKLTNIKDMKEKCSYTFKWKQD